MDQRLLLLPNRGGDAQFAAASDSTCRNRVEKAIVRATRAQDRQGANREIAAARSTPGGTSGGDLAIGSPGARRRPPAPGISREPNVARASQTRFAGDARRSGRPRSACKRAIHRNIKPYSECGAAPRAQGNYAGTRLAKKRPPDFAAWSHRQRQDGNLLASDSGSTPARTQCDRPRS